jgi:hypothetical protein
LKWKRRKRDWEERFNMFTPVETTIGAVLLQQATSNLLYQNGNILGASGLIRQLLSAPTKETLAFFAGMAFSYFPLKVLAPHLITNYPSAPQTWQAVLVTVGTALLAGWGTKVREMMYTSCCKLTAARCRMAAHPGICFAASPD